MTIGKMRIRRLGGSGRFFEFDDEQDCAWCEAGRRYFDRHPELPTGEIIHLENDRGGKRTITLTNADPIVLECEPYVFFRDDD